MNNNEKTCIICYDDYGFYKLCKNCKYLYCGKCAYKIKYNCSICIRLCINTIPDYDIVFFDIFDNDTFLNNILNYIVYILIIVLYINHNIWIFNNNQYYFGIFYNIMMFLFIILLLVYILYNSIINII